MKRSFFVLAACVAAVAASTTLPAATVSGTDFCWDRHFGVPVRPVKDE